tara:strand:- start:953 stop:1267 length:315 start_codon:yes stop_codon:yes gene_type:complete
MNDDRIDGSTGNKPIDGEFGLSYQIFILRRMINELPEDIRGLLLTQIDVITKAIDVRQKILISQIMPKLLDLHLDIKYMEFDRQAVQNERDDLAARLKEILGDD